MHGLHRVWKSPLFFLENLMDTSVCCFQLKWLLKRSEAAQLTNGKSITDSEFSKHMLGWRKLKIMSISDRSDRKKNFSLVQSRFVLNKYVNAMTYLRTFPRKSLSVGSQQIQLYHWDYSLSNFLSSSTARDCRASQMLFHIFVLVCLVDSVIFWCVRCSESEWHRVTSSSCEGMAWLIAKERKRKLFLLPSSSGRKQSDVIQKIRTNGHQERQLSIDGRISKQAFQSRAFDDCAREFAFSHTHRLT